VLLLCGGATVAWTCWGYYYHRYEGRERKNTIAWGSPAVGEIPGWGMGPGRARRPDLAHRERRHHLAREQAELLLELLGREALGPVDHEVLEPGILRRDGLDPLDDVRRRAAEPGLLLDAVGERGDPRGRARRTPRAALRVGVAAAAARREPRVTLVVRGLATPLRLLGRARQAHPGPPAR